MDNEWLIKQTKTPFELYEKIETIILALQISEYQYDKVGFLD